MNAEPAADEIRNVAVLGATGSVGQAALEVIAELGKPWKIWGISGHRQGTRLQELVRKYRPSWVVAAAPDLGQSIDCRYSHGPDQLTAMACDAEVDIVVAAIVGRAGLESTLAAISSGKRVALANKETLVVAGPLVHRLMRESSAELIPVDSEHSAIYQCLQAGPEKFASRLILTASGGPMRGWPFEKIQQATVQQALAHPTWQMGPKITIDSATMMNKALEVIEARWLFNVPVDAIEVVVHPQSVIHSMVEFTDGSIVAQMSPPDMRLPIQYALTYPECAPGPARRLDRSLVWNLQLEPVDRERFPAIDLGFEVARIGGTAGAVLNAANEEAVEQFLGGKIRLTDIAVICRDVLHQHEYDSAPNVDRLLALDCWARTEVSKWIYSTRTSAI